MSNELTIASSTDPQEKIDSAAENNEAAARVPIADAGVTESKDGTTRAFEHARSERTMLQERLDAAEAELQELTYPENENETVTTNEAAKAEEGATKTAQEETPDALRDVDPETVRMARLDARRDFRRQMGLPPDDEYYASLQQQHLSTPQAELDHMRAERFTSFQSQLKELAPTDLQTRAQALIAQGLDVSIPVQDALVSLDGGPQTLIYLIDHPEELRKLASMSDYGATARVAQLAARLTPQKRSISAAPPPIKPVGGSATKSSVPAGEMPYQEYKAMREREIKNRYRGR
jgi:hypothetical protein